MRDGIFVIDLEQTLIMMKRALNFIKQVSLRRGYIFYVPAVSGSLRNGNSFGLEQGKSFVNQDFLQLVQLVFLSPESFSSSKQRGILCTLTNKRQGLPIFGGGTGSPKPAADQRVEEPLEAKSESVAFKKQDQDGVLRSSPSIQGYPGTTVDLTCSFRGQPSLGVSRKNASKTEEENSSHLCFKPEVLFILQTIPNSALIKQAIKLQIPIVAIIDSNSNVSYIQYPIPGSDDAIQAQDFYTELLISALIDAKKNEAKALLSPPRHS